MGDTPQILSDRAVLNVSGPEAGAFLHRVITQATLEVPVGEARFSALLTPQGKILADFFLLATETGFLIDCHASLADDLLRRLSLYRLRAKVACVAAPEFCVGASASAPPAGDFWRFRDPRHDDLGWRLIAPQGALTLDRDDGAQARRRYAVGAPECGADYAAGEWFLTDVNADLLDGVDYKKGCFVGQEVTSRMKRKSDIRKRALQVFFDGPPPPPGSDISVGPVSIGAMLGGADGQGLAVVRIDRLQESGGEARFPDGRSVRMAFPAIVQSR